MATQRHSGENQGRGIVHWSSEAGFRFRGTKPALQALDFVREHSTLSEEDKVILDGPFPITTLDRLLSTPSVRSKIGFEIKDGKLLSALPPEEAIKPLRRIVLDLARGKKNVTELRLVKQQIDYISSFEKGDMPDVLKRGDALRALEGITEKDFPEEKLVAPRRKVPKPPARTSIVPRSSVLNVTSPKIAEIYEELRKLRMDSHPNAIAVLLRVFMETSVDHYLTRVASPAIPLSTSTSGGDKEKPLRTKIEEAMKHMMEAGANKKDFDAVRKGMGDKNHPLSVDLLHSYIHSRFLKATERDLTAAWDGAQPFFDRIWP